MPYLTVPEELGDLLPGEPAFRAEQLKQWLYEHPVLDPADMTNLPARGRSVFGSSHWPFSVEVEQSSDRVVPASGCSGPPTVPPSKRS